MMSRQQDPDNLAFQIDFEKLNDDYIEIIEPGNEEFYDPATLQQISTDKDERRRFKYYYDVYEPFEEVVAQR